MQGDESNLYDSTHYDQYIVAIYWTVTTITTVGYGDISISNNLERLFTILVMIVGVICFSYSTGSLSTILNSKDN